MCECNAFSLAELPGYLAFPCDCEPETAPVAAPTPTDARNTPDLGAAPVCAEGDICHSLVELPGYYALPN